MAPDNPTSAAPAARAQLPQQPAGDSYQALYRRYRPSRFSEVRGQDHVTRALRNAVREGRVAHAYLFSGPRGTGKTSTARILAMALNCEAPTDGEPDGTCLSCKAVRSGSSMDVFELDAASNRKLDEMRDLLSRVALGTPGRWKVYIIDEVHQLTPDAASALLKTLEEPPPHVVFVLATTDPQKVLPTILSRTQHFEFRLLGGDVLTSLLDDINRDAGLGLAPAAVRLAVQKGHGSARDAESALEQLAAVGGEDVAASYLDGLVSALSGRDPGAVLEAVAMAISRGVEPRRLGSELVERLREAFLALQAPALVQGPPTETAGLAETAQSLGLPLLVRSMEVVGQALVEMRDSVDPRVTLEVALVRLASPALAGTTEALVERVERLERALGVLPERSGAEASRAPAGPVPAGPVPAGPVPAGPVPAGPVPAGPAPAGPAAASPAGPLRAARRVTAHDESGPPSGSPASVPSGPAEARIALGALLRGVPAGQAPAGSSAGRQGSTGAASRPGAGPSSKTVSPVGPPVPGSSTGPACGLPSRDELTKAWGDSVLGLLERPAQFYLAHGWFRAVDEAAVLAFSDGAVMSRAAKYVGEAEAALARHFGQRVPLRLVLDPEVAPAAAPSRQVVEKSQPRVPSAYVLDEPEDIDELLEVPSGEALSAEQRVLEAFPGAVLEQ